MRHILYTGNIMLFFAAWVGVAIMYVAVWDITQRVISVVIP